jgi:hypothetical protein
LPAPPGRKICTLVGAAGIVLLCLGSVSQSLGSEGSEGGAFKYLGHGTLGKNVVWSGWVEEPPSGAPKTSKLCVTVDMKERLTDGLYTENELRECGDVSPGAPLGQAITGGSTGSMEGTAVVLAFVRAAKKIKLDLGKRGTRVVVLKRLDKAASERVGVKQISYWAHGFLGPVCVRRLTVYNRAGAVLSQSGNFFCEPK